jgi:NAD(P)H-quinone oxidoreductase subunit 5
MLLTVALIVGYGLLLQTHGRTSATWRRLLFAGLYLDEWVTRTTLRVWPVTLPTTASRKTVTSPAPRSTHERLA